MTDKKLIDNEIVKELERYSDVSDSDITTTCFKTRLLKEIYLFINHLQAENERLEAECEEQYESAEATIRAEIASGGTSCHWCEDKVRIEAYKECIEKVNNKIRFLENRGFSIHYVVKDALNNLSKELVGE